MMKLSREICLRSTSTLAAGWLLSGFLATAAAAQPGEPPQRLDPHHTQILTPDAFAKGLPTGLSETARQRMASTIREHREAKQRRGATESKIGSALRALAQNRELDTAAPLPWMHLDAKGRLRVAARLTEVSDASLEALRRGGLEITRVNRATRTVYGGLATDALANRLGALAALPALRSVQLVLGDVVRTGSVLSEGDAAHRADDVKNLLGVDGTGVKVCVISDGTDGAALSVASGDLPGDGSGQPDVDLCNINDNSGAEGTAMLEIVHDLAPGAQLGFCPGFDSSGDPQSIADAIDYLAQQAFGGSGCDVIVDDVGNYLEPYFQDGAVAQAVDAAAASGVVYFSAAGNDAQSHYEDRYVDTNPGDDLVFPLDTHDFGVAAGGASDLDWAGLVGGGGNFFAAFLQWSNPSGGASDDFDLYLFDQNGFEAGNPAGIFPVGGLGLDVQDGDDDPLEVAFVVNQTAATQVFFLIVDRFSGSADTYLEMNFNGFFTVQSPEDYTVSKGSIWGHPAARGAITVAATGAVSNADGTPNPNLDIIEPFSSLGPSIIFFTPNGFPFPHRRFKPELTAADGVSVTANGGFFTPFFGTSAAAPHAAAIAALVLEAKPGLGPRAVEAILSRTAADRGAPGPDTTWGKGFIDAYRAVRLALSLP